MVKLQFKLGNTKAVRLAMHRAQRLTFRRWHQCIDAYKQLLTYIKSAVTRNYSEKSINSILDHISSSLDMDFMETFYSTTLSALEESQNEVRDDHLYFLLWMPIKALVCRGCGSRQI